MILISCLYQLVTDFLLSIFFSISHQFMISSIHCHQEVFHPFLFVLEKLRNFSISPTSAQYNLQERI